MLLSLSNPHSTKSSLHTFCETSHPQRLWLKELFISEEWDCMVRELTTWLTHFSAGVIVFPVSPLFHFGITPNLFQLNWKRFRPLSSLSSFPHTLYLFCWLKLVSSAWTRGIQTNSVTAPWIQKPPVLRIFSKALLCVNKVFVSKFCSIIPTNPNTHKRKAYFVVCLFSKHFPDTCDCSLYTAPTWIRFSV